jgi:Protein of unknown function (DUF565)
LYLTILLKLTLLQRNKMANTKLLKLLINLEIENQKKIEFFEKNFAFSIFFLFFGFVCGNLFGTFLTFFRHFTNWDGTIITITILFIELINYLNYTTNLKNKFIQTFSKFNSKNDKLNKIFGLKKNVFVFLNFSKIGLLLGFFSATRT